MKKFLQNMFIARTGVSSMRWVFVWTVFIATVVPLLSWAIVYLQDKSADIPTGVVTLSLGAIGGITAGKVTQSFGENRTRNVEPAA